MSFAESYAGRVRAQVGPDTLLKLPGACALVVRPDDGAVLLERSHHASGWRLPGGLADADETLIECAAREVFEETALTLEDLTPFAFFDGAHHPTTLPNGDRYHAMTLLCVTSRYSGTLTIDPSELAALGWFAPDALPTPLHPSVPRALEAYARFAAGEGFQWMS